MVSCDEGFEELNLNPTQANELDPKFQFKTLIFEIFWVLCLGVGRKVMFGEGLVGWVRVG